MDELTDELQYLEKYMMDFHKLFLDEGFAASRILLTNKVNEFKSLTIIDEDNCELNIGWIQHCLVDIINLCSLTLCELDMISNRMTDGDSPDESTVLEGDEDDDSEES